MLFPDLPARTEHVRARIEAAVRMRGGGDVAPVRIVAVTKTHGPEAARAAWQCGIADCGENRVQDALPKIAAVDVPVRWHMIGHMQRNKVAALDEFVLLQSLDSSRLADAVHRLGISRGRAVDALVQVNTSGELSKGGFSAEELRAEAERLAGLPGVRVTGVMTIAPLDADEGRLRGTFAGARAAFRTLQQAGHPVTELSMGMSNDYVIAVEEGATMVRLGSALFGARGA